MQLTKEEVQEVVDLVRIGLTEEEIVERQKDMSNVLDYFDKLSELDTDKVEEIGHITGMNDVYRSDQIEEATEEEKKGMMENVKEEQNGYIKVQSVL
ncbi:MAG: Asp-tRNA(Asn)/Glu-tRNA(Gln) amidotransferase subunit GatC [Candidatus Moranbacteria bacterium]|nr:Asp-tRNA(Asn)/Glu-tRNA(Gln) amidotransferase subunit GatC [Candidatus Moranbacteria bacterium]